MKQLRHMLITSSAALALLALHSTTGFGQPLNTSPTPTTTAGSQTYTGAPWRFGVYGGLNFNMIGAGSQTLEGVGSQFNQAHVNTGRNDVIDGTGLGFYFGAMTEYNPGSTFGGQLRVGIDDRSVKFNDWDVANADSQKRFTAHMTYISIEPLLRINIGSPAFHAVVGPLLAFKLNTTYDFTLGRDEVNLAGQPIPGTNSFTYGVSGGVGYDININSKSTGSTRWYLTPFLEGSYMMDQRTATERDADRDDIWVTTSVRGGFQLKFGSAPDAPVVIPVVDALPLVDISLRAPSAISEQRKLTDMFPLRNYLFFENGSTSLPGKYVKLDPAAAAAFREQSLTSGPGTGSIVSDRSSRQMSVYYNAMNVYGDRLRNNPSATIELVGSAPVVADGLTMANNVKDYLVSSFGIDPARISTRGAKRAPHESGTRATPKEDLGLVADENVRVEVLSSDNSILKPVKIETMQSDIVDNDLVISVGASGAVADWTVQVTGEGMDKTYGPYRTSSQRIDARPILMDRTSGTYTAKVVARTADNRTIEKTQSFSLVRRTEPPVAGTRFSILFEYDESKTVSTYDQFLRQEVAPNIPAGSTVVIYGHTDRIGIDDHNYELSTRRAAEAMNVLQDELNKLGRSVKFDTYGFGENEERAPFMNNAPETRYYNRTVLIEVIPNS